ncbi:MAG: sulfatase [Prolixibacteraceae bacterium]|jgi:arylsulfatase A-like enzyme|nr:sulfatase [Prolixibacteraceae bacterium]
MKTTTVLSFFSTISVLSGQAKEPPNIVWLMSEDIGLDIECYGMPAVKTPNLNQLAEEGVRFTNCFCTNPICSPSRSAMMTGVHQLKINAHHHRSNRDVPLREPYKPFTYHLRNAGYTCILGNSLVMGKGRKIDVNFKHTAIGPWDGRENVGLFDKYDEFTKEDQPFFAQIQLNVTHRGDWWDRIRRQSAHPVDPGSVVLPPYMADHPTIRLDWAKYLDQIEYMDHEVGLLVRDLKEKGLYENTVIIFIGDNGRCNIRGKGYLFDAGLHVPLIVHWPKGIPPGQVRDEVICTTDITATILDLAGIEIPDYMTGQSFLKKDFAREFVFSTRDLWDEIMEQSRSLSSGQWKYISNRMPWVPYDAHQAYLEFYRPALHVMRRLKYENKLAPEQSPFFENTKPKEQLFNLKDDPHELDNLAEKPGFQEKLHEMRALLTATEKQMSPVDSTFTPDVPEAVNVVGWLKYTYPEVYLEMLNGKEVGFQNYSRMYKNAIKK